MRKALTNLLLVLAGVCAGVLLLEVVIFRFVLLPSDVPKLEFRDGLIRYQPNQVGVFRVKDEISAAYRINARGWNSAYEDFSVGTAESPVVAIIGDSYVEALQVDVNRSFAEQLQGLIGGRYRVYRAGISGAPLSQYLEILRKEILPLRPQIVIVNIAHNDFDESFRFKPGYYTSSFLKVDLSSGAPVERVPQEFVEPWYSVVRDSASWRFLVARRGVRPTLLRDLFLGQEQRRSLVGSDFEGTKARELEQMRIVTTYLLEQIARLTQSAGARLLVVIDGDRQAIYGASGPTPANVISPFELNEIVTTVAHAYSIPLVNLHPIFEAEYAKQGLKFNFENDYHWNERGHAVVALALHSAIKSMKVAEAQDTPSIGVASPISKSLGKQ